MFSFFRTHLNNDSAAWSNPTSRHQFLDRSARVIEAAHKRLTRLPNVRLCQGDMHALPFDDRSFDQVLHFHALTYADDPGRAVSESFRVLRPGGDLVLVTLHAHGHPEISATYSQVVDGFTVPHLRTLTEQAGFCVSQCDITSRERKKPYFEVVSVFARRPDPDVQAIAS